MSDDRSVARARSERRCLEIYTQKVLPDSVPSMTSRRF